MNKLVVTEVTASPISVFLGPSFLSPRAEKILSRYLCSTCSLTEIYFREEDDFLDLATPYSYSPICHYDSECGHCKDLVLRKLDLV